MLDLLTCVSADDSKLRIAALPHQSSPYCAWGARSAASGRRGRAHSDGCPGDRGEPPVV